jgi:glycosyltransferase involved in cell wall biosynthesis
MYFEYFESSDDKLKNLFVSLFANYLRLWDVTSSARVDDFIAISKHVQKRIRKFYRRESTVIYPPVDCDFFCPSAPPEGKGDYYLMVTAMAPYKRVDIAIQAFNRLGKSILVIGDGQGLKSLKKMAKKNVEFLGWQSDEKVRDYYRGCRAFIFPGEEDFGIAPVEAQACGSPVIAYERGGVLESVIPFPKENPTGVFFNHPTPESLITAVELFERNMDRFDSRHARENALRFNKKRFREEIRSFIESRYQELMQANRTRERG